MVMNGLDFQVGSKTWIYNYYGTNAESIKRDVANLKYWLSKQSHIPTPPKAIDIDKWLENILLMVKYSIERSKQVIDIILSASSNGFQIAENRDPMSKEMQLSFDNVIFTILPGYKDDGSKIAVFRPVSTEKDTIDMELAIKRCVMYLDLFLRDGVHFTSVEVVIDLENLRLCHITCFTPSTLRSLAYSMKAYPVRVTRINLVNASANVERIMAIFKPFISSKIMSRVVICKNTNILDEMFDNRMLPKEYRGYGSSLEDLNRKLADTLKSEREYFKLLDSWKADETKRVSNVQSITNDIIGSFRKLDVD